MTPLDYATILARSGILRDRAEAVGIIARGLSDESPNDPFRQPWPVEESVLAACQYLHLEPTEDLAQLAAAIMPTIPDHVLNR